MSMRAFESSITAAARQVFNNPKLRVKDLMEWSSGEIVKQEGEVVEKIPTLGVWVSIKIECDKRPSPTGAA